MIELSETLAAWMQGSIGADALTPPPGPPPGVYLNVPMHDYIAWDAINNSGISQFLRSPRHYVESLDAEDDETKSKTRGTVCHAGLLEPDRFRREYAIGPHVNLSTKEGKAEWAAFAALHPADKVLIRGADGAALKAANAAIWAHPLASKLLGGEGSTEVSILWVDELSGLRCKARIDKLAMEAGFVMDLKSTRDAREKSFRGSAHNLGYFRQAAHNLDGLAALGVKANTGPFDGFCIVAFENDNKSHCGVMVYELDPREIEVARIELRDAILNLAELKRETGAGRKYPTMDRWPGYSEKACVLRRPDWVLKGEAYAGRFDEEL